MKFEITLKDMVWFLVWACLMGVMCGASISNLLP